MVTAEAVERFRGDVEALTYRPPDRLGIAVSGGADSLALLLLAAAAYPGRISAATVDHGLRPESQAEAAQVAALCVTRGIAHSTLTLDWPEIPASNVQAQARERRYAALHEWGARTATGSIATAHHQDDQAETILMRLGRGSGIAGLRGIRASRRLSDEVDVVRPLLGWSRQELGEIVRAEGLMPVDDPSNSNPRHDRTRFRQLLAATDLLPADRIAAAARHLIDAEEALYMTELYWWPRRCEERGDGFEIDAMEFPFELLRRLMIRAINVLRYQRGTTGSWRSDKLPAVMDLATELGQATIAGVLIRREDEWTWVVTAAPARKS